MPNPNKKFTKTSFPLKDLRRKMGFTQKQLADKLNVERTRITRLERKAYDRISIGDLKFMAQGMGIPIPDLMDWLFRAHYLERPPIEKCKLTKPYFTHDEGAGYRFYSLLKNPEMYFAGTIILDPLKTLPHSKTPRAQFLFYFVLEGGILLATEGRQWVVREKESFTISEEMAYELYNSNHCSKAVVLIFASPTFIHRRSQRTEL